jgi:hypothetical protein
MIKKVLISSPTAAAKNYCAKDWIEHVRSLKYPNKELVLFDNTLDKGRNAAFLESTYGVKCDWAYTEERELFKRMAISHDKCRQYAIDNNFEWWLHLESDVFPPEDVIERLLSSGKKVIGGLYHIKTGKERTALIQELLTLAPHEYQAIQMTNDKETYYIDGKTKRVYHIGLGCMLIHRSVFSKIQFRMLDGVDCAPDSFFAEDCNKMNIPIHVDTSIICEHRNQSWGSHGVTFE